MVPHPPISGRTDDQDTAQLSRTDEENAREKMDVLTKCVPRSLLKATREQTGPYLPYTVAVLFVLCSAGALYICTSYSDFEPDPRIGTLEQDCLGATAGDFGTHVLYVVALSTTIGYGNINACTTSTKIGTIVISLIGLPLMVFIVVDAGDRMQTFCRSLVSKYQKQQKVRRNRLKSQCKDVLRALPYVHVANETLPITIQFETVSAILPSNSKCDCDELYIKEEGCDEDDDDCTPDLPPWLGALVLAICVFLCSLFYYWVEGYDSSFAAYFAALIFLAGDFTVKARLPALPMYIVIFVGFSMLSMTVNSVLGNIQNAVTKIKSEAKKEIGNAGLNAEGKLDIPPIEDFITGLVKKHGSPYLVVLMPKSQTKALEGFCKDAVANAEQFLVMKGDLENKIAQAATESVRTESKCTSTADLYMSLYLDTGNSGNNSAQIRFSSNQSQTRDAERTDAKNQTPNFNPPVSEKATYAHPAVVNTSSLAVCETETKNVECQLLAPPERDASFQVTPSARSVGMQHPRVSKWYRLAVLDHHKPGVSGISTNGSRSGSRSPTNSTTSSNG